MDRDKLGEGKAKVLLSLILGALIEIALLSFFVTLFWNITIPTIVTGVGPITYWQGMGLLMLCKFLTYRETSD